jgi:hypothetical protein
MIGFNPDVHTPDALSHELNQVLNVVPGALLVGSLGRAAFYDCALGDPTYEYRQRGQLPVRAFQGGPADIDLLEMPPAETAVGPFAVDRLTFGGRQVTIAIEDGDWHLQSSNRGYDAVIDPVVFEPVPAKTVYGAACNTVPAQTHLALLGIGGTLRPQDILARRLITENIQKGGLETLPVELYEPFKELRELNHQSLLSQIRKGYRSLVPRRIREPLAPLMQPVKDHFLR